MSVPPRAPRLQIRTTAAQFGDCPTICPQFAVPAVYSVETRVSNQAFRRNQVSVGSGIDWRIAGY